MEIKCPECGAIEGFNFSDDRLYDKEDDIRKVNVKCKCGNTFIVKYRGKPIIPETQ